MTTVSNTKTWRLADSFRAAAELGDWDAVLDAGRAITDYLGIPASDDPETDERIGDFLVRNADAFQNRRARKGGNT